jgi:hypothetical protein
MSNPQNIHDSWDDTEDYVASEQPLDDWDPRLDVVEKQEEHPFENMTKEEAVEGLHDKWWRLNHLYYIIDKYGKRVLFRPNKDQTRFYQNIWFQNLILKARQRGFTTLIDISYLDDALFYNNIEAGIIAHNREDVSKIFRRKILYPYENLPEMIKTGRPTKSKSKTEIEFENNSIISVGTSMRSGTLNRLHVSEFGKVCARYPEKAREIVTGAFEAIHTQTGEAIITVESTAEGKGGYFHDYCKEAQDRDKLGQKPTRQEFKFHFFAWWDNNENELHEAVPISKSLMEYFAKIESIIGVKLSLPKRFWYVTKWKKLGEDMKREHPSTAEEAFEQSIKGAYFSQQFTKIREEKRICSVPYQKGISVHTWWDIGMNDVTAIWFTQDIGREVHVIDYMEGSGEGFDFYKDEFTKTGYSFGRHYGPHDLSVREIGNKAKSRYQAAKEIGLHFTLIPRINVKIDSVNAARRFLSICWFDETKCVKGLSRLENYRKKWNIHNESWDNNPMHDINSNGADAFQTLGMGHDFKPAMGTIVNVTKTSSDGWT